MTDTANPSAPTQTSGPAASRGTVRLALEPPRTQVEAGSSPAEASLTLQNLGEVVEEYIVEVLGLDPSWFAVSTAGDVGLFPNDQEQLRLTFHPPAGPGLRAGSYPYEVRVRSRAGTQQNSVHGMLDIRGQAALRLDLTPLRQAAKRRGRFTLQVANTGAADAQLSLEARDAEDACRFRYPRGDSFAVPARGKLSIPLEVVPRRRPWTGQERTYDFTVAGRSTQARSIVQPFPGQYTYRPLLTSVGLFFRLFLLLLLIAALVVVVPVAWGASRPLRDEFGRRYCNLTAGIHALQDNWPCGQGTATCSFQFYFREFAEADRDLVGSCASNETPDALGNSVQYTTRGVLFWLKQTQTVYFMSDGKLYVFEQAHPRLLRDPTQ